MDKLEKNIGYVFEDKNLLKLALTHSSYANEMGDSAKCNERLEFLGDSVLSIIVSDYLFNHYENAEGDLTKLRASLVCEDALYDFAKEIKLGDYILLGKGEKLNGGNINLIVELSENLIVILNLSQSLLNAEVELDLRLGTRWAN